MLNKIIKYMIVSGLMLFSAMALADGTSVDGKLTVAQVFANSTPSVIALMKASKYIAMLIGLTLIVGAILKLSSMQSTNQQNIGAKVPISMFAFGVIIFSLSGSIDIVFQTLAMGDNSGSVLIEDYDSGFDASMTAAMKGVLYFIQFIGYIAFIRGWVILNQYATGKKDDGLFRGVTHVLGGLLAIRVTWTAKVFINTFAPGLPIPYLTGF